MNSKKYRPVLTKEQIDHILSLAKREIPISDLSVSLIASLAPFTAKIESNAVLPAYTEKPRVSLAESLGFTTSATFHDDMIGVPEYTAPPGKQFTKEEFWAASYAKYLIDPASCTMAEIDGAHEHMYLNELMTPEQLAEFENKNRFGDY